MQEKPARSGPDFLGIGAQRCGTTWLHRVLSMHPDLWLPPIKELHYFDGGHWGHYSKHLGKRTRKLHYLGLWDLRFFIRYPGDNWYKSLFRSARRKNLITGEITPRYAIIGESGYHHIKRVNPGVKLIYLMRHPIERCWSNYVNSVRKDPDLDYEEAIGDTDAAIEAVIGHSPQFHSQYFQNITGLEQVFDTSQIYYGFMEDIVSRPAWLAQQISRFLEVDPSFYTDDMLPTPVGIVGRKHPIPQQFALTMANVLKEDTSRLADRFGSYPRDWLDDMTALTAAK